MRQKPSRRFPFAAIGLLLIAVSVAPTVVGMIRGFDQLQRGETPTAINSGVALSYHPTMIVCCNVGLVFLIIGVVRALCCGRAAVTSPPAAMDQPA